MHRIRYEVILELHLAPHTGCLTSQLHLVCMHASWLADSILMQAACIAGSAVLPHRITNVSHTGYTHESSNSNDCLMVSCCRKHGTYSWRCCAS